MSVAKNVPGVLGSRALVSASMLIFASGLVLSIGGFAFHALASRLLGVNDYGTFYALISLYSLATLPVNVLAPVVTKYSAEFSALHDDAHVRGLIGFIVRAFAVLGLIYIACGFTLSIPLSRFLHLSVWSIPVVGVMASVVVLSTTMRAIAQGVHAYAHYAWSTAGEGVAKVAALAVAAAAGLTVFRTLGAFTFGLAAGAAVIALPLLLRYRRVIPVSVVLDWKRIVGTMGAAAVLTLSMTAMGFADVLIVKHYFSANEAGLYSVASLCGKIVLYFVGFVPAILIPQATSRHARGERTRKLLWSAIAFIAVVAICGVIGFRFGGSIVLHALAGRQFDAALPLLPTYAAAMAALALINSLGSYGISTHRLGFAVPLLLGICALFVVMILVHPTLAAVATELMIGNAALCVVVGISLALQSRMKPA